MLTVGSTPEGCEACSHRELRRMPRTVLRAQSQGTTVGNAVPWNADTIESEILYHQQAAILTYDWSSTAFVDT
jgi:hypothetical protein